MKKIWRNYWNEDNSFNLFDMGKLDLKNKLLIYGRNDDVINVRGHRIVQVKLGHSSTNK